MIDFLSPGFIPVVFWGTVCYPLILMLGELAMVFLHICGLSKTETSLGDGGISLLQSKRQYNNDNASIRAQVEHVCLQPSS